jgi:hypothetical protein
LLVVTLLLLSRKLLLLCGCWLLRLRHWLLLLLLLLLPLLLPLLLLLRLSTGCNLVYCCIRQGCSCCCQHSALQLDLTLVKDRSHIIASSSSS